MSYDAWKTTPPDEPLPPEESWRCGGCGQVIDGEEPCDLCEHEWTPERYGVSTDHVVVESQILSPVVGDLVDKCDHVVVEESLTMYEDNTKRMDVAIKFFEEGPGEDYMIEFQPGNGTRYLVGLARMRAYPLMRGACGGVDEGGWLVTWINKSACCTLQPEGYLAPHYLLEKLGAGSMADAIVLSRLIAHFTDRTVDDWTPTEG